MHPTKTFKVSAKAVSRTRDESMTSTTAVSTTAVHVVDTAVVLVITSSLSTASHNEHSVLATAAHTCSLNKHVAGAESRAAPDSETMIKQFA